MKNQKVRLNKYIASAGYCSRRKADELILLGKVTVNNRTVFELGLLVGPNDSVMINKKIIKPESLAYIRYYKPAGYIKFKTGRQARQRFNRTPFAY